MSVYMRVGGDVYAVYPLALFSLACHSLGCAIYFVFFLSDNLAQGELAAQ